MVRVINKEAGMTLTTTIGQRVFAAPMYGFESSPMKNMKK